MNTKIKYPRTPHLPWSQGVTSDDRIITDVSQFYNKPIVITEKMDGENTTLSRDYYHARSLDTLDHPSRSWIKGFWASIRHNIPQGFRICGENLYARHSIPYTDLASYFYGFSVWDDDYCLDWKDTTEYLTLLGIEIVPVLGIGSQYMANNVHDSWVLNYPMINEKLCEGYVVRTVEGFHLSDFAKYVAKYVRPNHVQENDTHWMTKPVIPNKLKYDN